MVADGLSRRPDLALGAADNDTGTLATLTSVTLTSRELHDAIVSAYTKDQQCAELIAKLPEGYRMIDGLLVTAAHQVRVPADRNIRSRILRECHDEPLGGHIGQAKTLEKVTRTFYWPGVHAEVRRYVSTCLACQANKPSTQLPMGTLQPLPIPSRLWQVVTMDFITHLPKTKRGHDCIIVVVCKLIKQAHYFATTTQVDAPETARLFFHEVVRHHGLPETIVSDRDPRFTSLFWQSLWAQLGTKLAMSTAYHPQSDGQTERQNRTLEEMLRAYVNPHQDDWDDWLVPAEIAYNNSVQASTGETPFFLSSGQHPRFALDIAIQPDQVSNNAAASSRISALHQHIESAKAALELAQKRQATYADQARREVELHAGQRVLLSTHHLNLKSKEQTKKLLSKYIGPFAVKRVISPVAYELELPNTLQIHPVFHISKLKLASESSLGTYPARDSCPDPARPPPEFVNEDGQEVWEVEAVLNKRTQKAGRNRQIIEYLVKWKGYPTYEATWQPASQLCEAMDAVQAYEDSNRRSRQRQ